MHAQEGLPFPDMDMAHHKCLHPVLPPPDLVKTKDFVRFYISTSKPRLDACRPTVDSINTVIEWFVAGFMCVTGNETMEKERSEVYHLHLTLGQLRTRS
jgi:hypothetical protein